MTNIHSLPIWGSEVQISYLEVLTILGFGGGYGFGHRPPASL